MDWIKAASNRFWLVAKALGWGAWKRRGLLERWTRDRVVYLDGSLNCHGGEVLDLRDLVLDRNFVQPKAALQQWYLEGFFQIGKQAPPKLEGSQIFRTYLRAMVPRVAEPAVNYSGLTIAIQRYEATNLYHSLVDIYNAFLLMKIFGTPVRILFIDGLEVNPFESLWSKYFDRVMCLSELPQQSAFERLVVGPNNHLSPLSFCLGPAPPYVPEFASIGRLAPCTAKPQITLISRGDNPRRVTLNEAELIEGLRQGIPEATLQTVRFEKLSLLEQREIIARTKLLIGQHGAGLSHCMFLPQDAAMLELFPGVAHALCFHFFNFARWSGIRYDRWVNWHRLREATGGKTEVDVQAIVKKAQRLFRGRSERRTCIAKQLP